MKSSGLIVCASTSLVLASLAQAASATAAIDPTRRNETFSPAATVSPAAQQPQAQRIFADEPGEKKALTLDRAVLGERRAPIELAEAQEKTVAGKNMLVPPVTPKSAAEFEHRMAPFSTAADTRAPSRVAKYQDRLTAATATNMARFPAPGGATVAKLNRFVFRKNPPDLSALAPAGTAAAGAQPEPASRR